MRGLFTRVLAWCESTSISLNSKHILLVPSDLQWDPQHQNAGGGWRGYFDPNSVIGVMVNMGTLIQSGR